MSKKVIIIEHIKNATITVNQFFYFKEFINYTEIGKLLYL